MIRVLKATLQVVIVAMALATGFYVHDYQRLLSDNEQLRQLARDSLKLSETQAGIAISCTNDLSICTRLLDRDNPQLQEARATRGH